MLCNYTKLLYRVEGAHTRLKRLLRDSIRDLYTCWDAMNNMLILQHIELKVSFQNSINTIDHRFNKPFYKRLWDFVSTQAQSLIFDELNHSTTIGVDSSACGYTLRTTHSLSCAYELARYSHISGSIPLSSIHVHWKMSLISSTYDAGDS